MGEIVVFRRCSRRVCALVLLLMAPVAALAAEDVAVETARQGDVVEVKARATLDAPHALILATLTDYEKLSEFVPGLRSSRVLERRGPAAIVHQQGEAGFLFFTHPIDVVVESTERTPWLIEVRLLKGNLRQLSGRYEIDRPAAGEAGKLVLRWTGTIEPAHGLPPLFGEWLVRANIEDQFFVMVREIDRREAERRRKSGE